MTPAAEIPPIEPWVREILRCPECHAELADVPISEGGLELVCQGSCGRAYPVREGIPVLLVDEGRLPTEGEPFLEVIQTSSGTSPEKR